MIYYVLMVLTLVPGIFYVKPLSQESRLKLQCLVLWLLYGLRSTSVGWDNLSYSQEFTTKLPSLGPKVINHYWMEPGYTALNFIIGSVTHNYVIFQFVVGAIVIISFYIFIKYNTINYSYTLFLFLSLGIYYFSMNVIREGVAISFLLIAVTLFKNNKKISALLLLLIAFSMHRSTIIFIIAFFIYLLIKHFEGNLSKICYWVIIISIVLCLVSEAMLRLITIIPFLNRYLSIYAEKGYLQSGNISYAISFGGLFILSAWLNKNYHVNDDFMFFSSIAVATAVLSISLNMIERSMQLFQPFLAVYFTNSLENVSEKNKSILKLIVAGVMMTFAFIYLYISENGYGRDGVIPYLFYWQK